MVETSNPTAGEAEATPAGGPIFPCTIECPWKKFNMSDPAAAAGFFGCGEVSLGAAGTEARGNEREEDLR